MKIIAKLSFAALIGVTSGCAVDTTADSGIDAGSLASMQAGIWIDPNGCDHWIIDDGVEGYLTPRLRPDGSPVCRDQFNVNNTENFTRKTIGDS